MADGPPDLVWYVSYGSNLHRERLLSYLTGDVAIGDAAGSLDCLGRIDNQVKVLGYRGELEEIDAEVRAWARTATTDGTSN